MLANVTKKHLIRVVTPLLEIVGKWKQPALSVRCEEYARILEANAIVYAKQALTHSGQQHLQDPIPDLVSPK